MLFAVYLAFAVSVGILIGILVCAVYNSRKKESPEEAENGKTYQLFAGSAKFSNKKFANYMMSALVPLDKSGSVFPRWYRHRLPLPIGHCYLKAVSVNDQIEFRPLPKATPLPPVIKVSALSKAS